VRGGKREAGIERREVGEGCEILFPISPFSFLIFYFPFPVSRFPFWKKPITTKILEAKTFYKAEEYHQDYHKKCPLRYNLYRHRSGRNERLEAIWK